MVNTRFQEGQSAYRTPLSVVPPVEKAPLSRDNRSGCAHRRKRQRRFVMILSLALLLLMIPLVRDGMTYLELRREHASLMEENNLLFQEQDLLKAELERLDNPAEIERQARENLGLVKPGETKIYSAIAAKDIPKQEALKQGEAVH